MANFILTIIPATQRRVQGQVAEIDHQVTLQIGVTIPDLDSAGVTGGDYPEEGVSLTGVTVVTPPVIPGVPARAFEGQASPKMN